MNEPRVVLLQFSIKGRVVGMSNGAAKWPDEVVEKARELYASGMSYKAVGEALGVCRGTVQKWVGRCKSNAKRVTPAVRVIARRRA